MNLTPDDFSGLVRNRRDMRELAAVIDPTSPWPTCLTGLTQRPQQFAPQGAARQHIQVQIEGLG